MKGYILYPFPSTKPNKPRLTLFVHLLSTQGLPFRNYFCLKILKTYSAFILPWNCVKILFYVTLKALFICRKCRNISGIFIEANVILLLLSPNILRHTIALRPSAKDELFVFNSTLDNSEAITTPPSVPPNINALYCNYFIRSNFFSL